MRESLYFAQPKPITAYMLAGLLIVVVILLLNGNSIVWGQVIILTCIALVLSGYSISYEIVSDFNNKRHFKLLGLTLFTNKLDIVFPDYITIFEANFKRGSEWGPVSAMGNKRSSDAIVIRLFKGNRHFTVFRTKSLQDAKEKANALSELIEVKIIEKV